MACGESGTGDAWVCRERIPVVMDLSYPPVGSDHVGLSREYPDIHACLVRAIDTDVCLVFMVHHPHANKAEDEYDQDSPPYISVGQDVAHPDQSVYGVDPVRAQMFDVHTSGISPSAAQQQAARGPK